MTAERLWGVEMSEVDEVHDLIDRLVSAQHCALCGKSIQPLMACDHCTEPSSAPEQGKPGRVKKVRATFHIPEALLEEARDAVVALSGPPERLTLATFAETAIRRELGRLKKKHNAGEDFPTRSAELRGGRPIGS